MEKRRPIKTVQELMKERGLPELTEQQDESSLVEESNFSRGEPSNFSSTVRKAKEE